MTKQIFVTTDSTGTKAWTNYRLLRQSDLTPIQCYELLAESERKRYEVIDWRLYHEICESNEGFCGCFDFGMVCENKKNTRYLAEIVDENTVRIIKEV